MTLFQILLLLELGIFLAWLIVWTRNRAGEILGLLVEIKHLGTRPTKDPRGRKPKPPAQSEQAGP